MNNKYARAYKEVLEIIKYFPKEEYNKIPKEKIDFFNQNMDKDYSFEINPNIDLSEQNISIEANATIVALYMDYFATEEQKEKIIKILKQNEIKEEAEKSKKYNPEDLFRNKNKVEVETEVEENIVEEKSLVEYKESFFTKFKNFIFKLLHIGEQK